MIRSLKRAVLWMMTLYVVLIPVSYAQVSLASLGWLDAENRLFQPLNHQQAVETLYQSNYHRLIWVQPDDQQRLESLIEPLTLTGLSDWFTRRRSLLQELRDKDLHFEYDVLATDTLIAHLAYVSRLQENQTTWLFGSGIGNDKVDPPAEVLQRLTQHVKDGTLSFYLTQLANPSPDYQAYLASIDVLRESQGEWVPRYVIDGLIRVGDELPSPDVLLRRIRLAGIPIPDISTDQPFYTEEQERVVKQFQRLHGLRVDGIIGPKTTYWLNYPVKERIRRLALNAERSRLWPEQRDSLILVNLPGFDLNFFYQSELAFQSKVIVGKVRRKTPMMTINMDSLVLNPTWNVPSKIMREDIIPILRYNPKYLDRRGIQVIKGWTNPVIIEASTIQWHRVNPRTFPYRMRQLAGPLNALGAYKFNTPNKRAIYLHDTPQKYLFDQPSRAFSSGCIRVEHADRFAMTLAQTMGFRRQNISPVNKPANVRIPLNQQVPVHLIYKTSWVSNGEIHMRNDVYGYDKVISPMTDESN